MKGSSDHGTKFDTVPAHAPSAKALGTSFTPTLHLGGTQYGASLQTCNSRSPWEPTHQLDTRWISNEAEFEADYHI
jgi:hypothetical protein